MNVKYLVAKASACMAVISLSFNSYPLVILGSEATPAETIMIIENIKYEVDSKNQTSEDSKNQMFEMAESFDPSPVYIQRGESVGWINNGSKPHTVTSVLSYGKALFFDRELHRQDNLTEPQYIYKFPISGVFNYY